MHKDLIAEETNWPFGEEETRAGTMGHAIRRIARLLNSIRSILAAPGRHIRWQIILPFAFLVVLLAAVTTYLTTQFVEGSLDERFENQLVESGRVSADTVARREDAHLEVARSVAFTAGLKETLVEADREELLGYITSIAANSGTEWLALTDWRGEFVTGVTNTGLPAVELQEIVRSSETGEWPLTQQALGDPERSKHAQIVETDQGRMLLAAAPLASGDDVVGAVLVGTSLDTLVSSMKLEGLADVTIYDFEGSPIASTFVLDPVEANLTAEDDAIDPSSTEGLLREHRTIWGRGYDLIYGDVTVSGEAVALYSVALPSDFIFDAGNSSRLQMVIIFGLGMAAILAIGLFLARRITRPVQRLVETAERVSRGDLTARTEVSTNDELGQLATCLNRMTERLEGQYMATMRALASAVAGQNPYTLRHSRRVGELATWIGTRMGLDDYTLAQLEIGGYLHDVGKIGIRSRKLHKVESLRPADAEYIESHPHIGISLPEDGVSEPIVDFLREKRRREAADEDDMGIVSRIIAVADVYDALTCERPGEVPKTSDEALDIMLTLTVNLDNFKVLDFDIVEALASFIDEWERSEGRGSDYHKMAAGTPAE